MKTNVVDLMAQAISKTIEDINAEEAKANLCKYDCYEAFTRNLNENLIKVTGDDLLLVKDTTSTANSGSRTIKVFRRGDRQYEYTIGAYFTIKVNLKLVMKTYSYFGSLRKGNTYQIKQVCIKHYNEEFTKYETFEELLENQKQQVKDANIKRYQEITGSAYTQFKDAVAVVEKCIAEKKEIDYFTMTVLRQFGNKYNSALEDLEATKE